jgi:DNA repair protein RadA/Sms
MGSISQLKEVLNKLINFAKKNNLILIVIGHITKEGEIAGPKTLEHLVDCVLYLEGERFSNFRLLRASKNRFGPTDEVGIFEMREKGLIEVEKPTAFLDLSKDRAPGKAIVGVVEGTRPLFFEVQSLVVPTILAFPRRVVKGVDYNKILLLLAVIRKNLNLPLDRFDVYVNVVGGVSIKSTSADLGIAASLVSSMKNLPFASSSVFIGEIGLLGEVRKVFYEDKIIKECQRFGFSKIYSSKNIQSVKQLNGIF